MPYVYLTRIGISAPVINSAMPTPISMKVDSMLPVAGTGDPEPVATTIDVDVTSVLPDAFCTLTVTS